MYNVEVFIELSSEREHGKAHLYFYTIMKL